MRHFGMTWVSVLILMASAVMAPAFSQCPSKILQQDPVHLGDTYNSEWWSCSPAVPSTPWGVCYDVFFNISADESAALRSLRVRSGGASYETVGKVYLDSEFVGYLAEATAERCTWGVSNLPIQLMVGFHNIRVCTSIVEYQTGAQYDDWAFYDLQLTCDVPVPTEAATWGHIKTIYQ